MTIQDIAVLFDLDGVIFDSEHFYSDFWKIMGKKYCPNVENFEMKIKGHGLDDIFAEFFSDNKIQDIIRQDIKLMEEQMTFTYIAGVENFIQSLLTNNIKICLVTSSKQNKMERVFQLRPEIKHYFTNIVTSDDIMRSKPAPDCYLKGAELCNVKPEHCIVFEDSLAGIEAARIAKMNVIALSTTFPINKLIGKAIKIIPDFTNIKINDILELL